MMFDKVLALLAAALANPQVKYIVWMVAADVVVNIAVSIYTGEFRLGYVANFMKSKLLPYILGYVAAYMIAGVNEGLAALPTTVWGFIVAALLGDVMDGVKKLGLPVPVALTQMESVEVTLVNYEEEK